MSGKRVQGKHFCDPKGNRLATVLVHVLEKDAQGRAKNVTIYYDDDNITVGELAGPDGKTPVEFLLVWMSDAQRHGKIGTRPVDVEVPDDGIAAGELKKR